MSAPSPLRLDRDTRPFLLKWGIALLVPVLIYTFAWQGDSVINGAFLGLLYPNNSNYAVMPVDRLVQSLVFSALFYLMVLGFGGYLVAVDSGRRKPVDVWVDVLLYAVVPIVMISQTNSLVLGIAISAVIWGVFILVRNILRRRFKVMLPLPPLATAPTSVSNQELRRRAIMGSVCFGTVLAVIWVVVDVIFYLSGSFPSVLLLAVLTPVRTVLLLGGSYFMGLLGARVAQHFTADAYARRNEQRVVKGRKPVAPGRIQQIS